MIILAIETSTAVCSASLLQDGKIIKSCLNKDESNHAQRLPVFIDTLLDEGKLKGLKPDAIALSAGPGSYTGLRIGTSLAKGLCYGLQVPLIPIPTLEVLCAVAVAQANLPDGAILCPMLDARRMEVYTALYQYRNGTIFALSPLQAKVVNEQGWLKEGYFFGNGAAKCRALTESENARFIDNILPDAAYMMHFGLAEKHTSLIETDMAYFEPYYLKEFTAAPSHIKGLQ